MNETIIPATLGPIAAYMGWRVSANGAHCIVKIDEEWRGRRDPLSDIRDAFLVVEKMRGEGWTFKLEVYRDWCRATFTHYHPSGVLHDLIGVSSDEQPPAAICAAAAAALASTGAAAGRAKGDSHD